MYIDTEGTFKAKRVIEIAERYEFDASEILENIAVARCHTTDQ